MGSEAGAAEEDDGEAARTTMQIKCLGGEDIRIEVSKNHKISEVKEVIRAVSGIPCLRQRLIRGEAVLRDTSLAGEHCCDDASLIEVSMIVFILFDGVFEELVEQGSLAYEVDAESTSEVQRKLAILTDKAGMALPTHAFDWFTFLMENGFALSMLNPNHCVDKADLHSHGLLYLQEDNVSCEFAQAKHIWLMDLATEEGAVVCYWMWEDDDDIWNGPANTWQRGKEVARFANLSEFFMSRVNELKRAKAYQQKCAEDNLSVSKNNTHIVIDIWKTSKVTGRREKEIVSTRFGDIADRTIGGLKQVIYEMTGHPVSSQNVGFKHMRRVELKDDKLISEYAFLRGGSRVDVIIRA